MPPTLYTASDSQRIYVENNYRKTQLYRTDYRRDLDRLMHSTCFRRLQGKTQLYPGLESDFFRNRLTHSLEVAQIAKSIAAKINVEHTEKLGADQICLELVEFAGLAHDLGHPPFGHQGEEALNKLMVNHGGYEGNAQTLRILRRIEKKGYDDPGPIFVEGIDQRVGLNLTARTLASILKYDKQIPSKQEEVEHERLHAKKGYYSFDEDTVAWIKRTVGSNRPEKKFKTIECQIMDVADDIAYSTYDLEDGLKAGFYTLMDVVFCKKELREQIASEVFIKYRLEDPYRIKEKDVTTILGGLFQSYSNLGLVKAPEDKPLRDQHHILVNSYYEGLLDFSSDGYARNFLTSSIVNRFIEGIQFEYDPDFPSQSEVYLKKDTLLEVEVLKKFTFITQVMSSRLKIAEFRGKDIVKTIFESLIDATQQGYELLPPDYRAMYEASIGDTGRRRIICDFVAGMTDRYAIEFYGRLKSENPETIFKPL